jgi:hypothetical protein
MNLTYTQIIHLENALQLAKEAIISRIESEVERRDGIVVSFHTTRDVLQASVLTAGNLGKGEEWIIKITSDSINAGKMCSEEEIEYAKYVQSILNKAEFL